MIYKHFDRQFPEGMLDSWLPTHSTDSSLDSLDISNRYLTPLRDVGRLAESVPFHKGVDPRNILRDMAKNNHVHTEDNYVEYFSMHRDSDGRQRSATKSTVTSIKGTYWIQIPVLRTTDVPCGRYCSSTAIFCGYSSKGRPAKDAHCFTISGTPGWSVHYQLELGKFSQNDPMS